MRRNVWVALMALGGAGSVLAQDEGLSVSAGLRAWHTEWTTFSYFADGPTNLALTQVSARRKWVAVPLLALRYGNFVGSISAMPSTGFSFHDGGNGKREEFDVNVGYAVLPAVNVTLGYKKVSQRDGDVRYEPSGPVVGVSGSAGVGGAMSLYGSLGVGKLKTPQSGGDNVVKFDADYRLTEVGLAYALGTDGWPRRWTFTAGYRIQVLSSKEAFGKQDGRDTTEGLTFGVVASF